MEPLDLLIYLLIECILVTGFKKKGNSRYMNDDI